MPDDLLITALKAARRNLKRMDAFERRLTDSLVYTLTRPGGSRAYPIRALAGGEMNDFLACFSTKLIAEQTLIYYNRRAGNTGKAAQVEAVGGFDLFFAAAKMGLGVCLNPENHADDKYFFSFAAVKKLLFKRRFHSPGPQPDSGPRSPFLQRSKQGRQLIEGRNTQIPIPDIDFSRPFTSSEMAETFGVSENALIREIAALEEAGNLDLSRLSVSIDEEPGANRIYDPLVAFEVGSRIQGPRGDEFRRWLTHLMQEYCLERRRREMEQIELKQQLAEAEASIETLEAQVKDHKRRISELEALPDQFRVPLNQARQELLLNNKRIAELESALSAAGDWACPETVAEACEAARTRYASRLVFHERVAQSVTEFSLKDDLKAAVEAAKMLKALAEVLQPMKFERDNFSEERFQDETGLALAMTESKATKRDRALDETRICFYEGRKISFYPHLKKTVQGVQMRLHFQFLADEKKILVCHLGDHLPNAKTKYLQ